jgi:hypothetical protein
LTRQFYASRHVFIIILKLETVAIPALVIGARIIERHKPMRIIIKLRPSQRRSMAIGPNMIEPFTLMAYINPTRGI